MPRTHWPNGWPATDRHSIVFACPAVAPVLRRPQRSPRKWRPQPCSAAAHWWSFRSRPASCRASRWPPNLQMPSPRSPRATGSLSWTLSTAPPVAPPRLRRSASPSSRQAATFRSSSPPPATRWLAGSAIAPKSETFESPPPPAHCLRSASVPTSRNGTWIVAATRDQMARWIGDRAKERDIRIAPAAAALLAERVGANVKERDVDRRRQGELAVSELEKLALYRLDGQIGPDDVKALVADAVPGSTWAFLDAVGMRRADVAAQLAERLDDVPSPLLVTHLHRRIKQLIDVADLLATGTPARDLVRILKLNPYVAEKLAEQARTWALPELDAALAGLLELDAQLKGHIGGTDLRRRAAVSLWIAERVRRPGQR